MIIILFYFSRSYLFYVPFAISRYLKGDYCHAMNVIGVVVGLLLLMKDTHGECNKTGRNLPRQSAQDQQGQSQNKYYAITRGYIW